MLGTGTKQKAATPAASDQASLGAAVHRSSASAGRSGSSTVLRSSGAASVGGATQRPTSTTSRSASSAVHRSQDRSSPSKRASTGGKRSSTLSSNQSKSGIGGLATTKRSVEPQQHKHIVIIGAGIVGASTAYYSSKKGAQVTVIDQVGPACHSSGKAGGFLALGWNSGPAEDLAKTSFALHQQLAREFEPGSIGFRPMTSIGLGFGGDTPEAGRPWLDKVSHIVHYTMGTKSTNAQVHPRKLTEMLLEHSGAQLIKATIVGVEKEGDRVVSVQTKSGECIPCDSVVFAMGPWTMKITQWFPILVDLLQDTVGRKYTSVVYDTICDDTYVSLESYHIAIVPRSDEVCVNGCPSKAELPDDPLDIEADEEKVRLIQEEVSSVSTQLAEAPMKTHHACFLPSSEDSQPVIGKIPQMSNAYVACGLTCWGILNGPATGKAMAELIIDAKATCVDLSAFDPGREPKAACIVQ